MSNNREWMYKKRATEDGYFNPEFEHHLTYFLNFAFSNVNFVTRRIVNGFEVSEVKCPCSKCKNYYYKTRDMVERDILDNGFMISYYLWYAHGESYPSHHIGQCSNTVPSHHVGQCSNTVPSQHVDQCSNPVEFQHARQCSNQEEYEPGEYTGHDQMIMDSLQPFQQERGSRAPQDPNHTAQSFYSMLEAANKPLWTVTEPETSRTSTFSAITGFLNWKSECNVSDSTYNKLLPLFKQNLPLNENLPTNIYETKKMLKPLELPKERIHVCKNHCMLFYNQNSDLDYCLVCKTNRYKNSENKVPNMVLTYMPIGPRLQRLFYSKKTARHLTWHSNHESEPNKMVHPSDGRAWKHFG